MRSFTLKIIEVDSDFYEGECVSLVIPTVDGSYGIMSGHSNLITGIVAGELKYRTKEEEDFRIVSVSRGLCKVEEGEVLVLVDSAENLADIDINRAEREAREAQEILNQKSSLKEYLVARTQLDRSLNRVRLHAKYNNDLFGD